MARGFIGLILATLIGGLLAAVVAVALLAPSAIATGRLDEEVIIAPVMVGIGLMNGATAGIISMALPRTSIRHADNFLLLLALAVLVSMFIFAMLSAGPYLALYLLITLPVSVLICSPWFRNKFEG